MLLCSLLSPLAVAAFFQWGSCFSEERLARNRVDTEKAFDHAFSNYWKLALPLDELDPVRCCGIGYGANRRLPNQETGVSAPPRLTAEESAKKKWLARHKPVYVEDNHGDFDILGGYCLTLIDSLDTLAIMNKKEAFRESVEYLSERQQDFFALDHPVIVFEVVIRVLGGLLSGHLLAVDECFGLNEEEWYDGCLLDLALDLGTRLLPAFSTPSGLPYPRINLASGTVRPRAGENVTNIASAGTLLLEFATLSELTGNDEFKLLALKTILKVYALRIDHLKLVPSAFNVTSGAALSTEAGIGASSDSFYEYLLKGSHLLDQQGEQQFSSSLWKAFHETYDGIMQYIRSPQGIAYHTVNIYSTNKASSQIDSLAAFFPGLQSMHGDVEAALMHYTFYLTQFLWYDGLTLERFCTKQKTPVSSSYFLRPKFIESTYHLYRATGGCPLFLEIGELFLEALNAHCKTACGYRTLFDITKPADIPAQFSPRMDSFFLAETLKYLYLLFSPDHVLHRDAYLSENVVWSTEAHPLMTRNRRLARYPANEVVLREQDVCQYFDRRWTSLTFKSLQREHEMTLFPFMDAAELLGITDAVTKFFTDPVTPAKKGHRLLKKFLQLYSTGRCVNLTPPSDQRTPTLRMHLSSYGHIYRNEPIQFNEHQHQHQHHSHHHHHHHHHHHFHEVFVAQTS